MQSKINIKLTFNSFDPKLTIWQELYKCIHLTMKYTSKAYCTKNIPYKNRLISLLIWNKIHYFLTLEL